MGNNTKVADIPKDNPTAKGADVTGIGPSAKGKYLSRNTMRAAEANIIVIGFANSPYVVENHNASLQKVCSMATYVSGVVSRVEKL